MVAEKAAAKVNDIINFKPSQFTVHNNDDDDDDDNNNNHTQG